MSPGVPVTELFVGEILPLVTLAVLVSGLTYRIRKWRRAGVANLAIFPAATTRPELLRMVLGEVLFFSSHRRQHKLLWSQTWLFHFALLVILVGHTRLITDWPLRVLLRVPRSTVETLAVWVGGFSGLLALVSCLFLLTRRILFRRVREISSGEEYGVVALLLGIFVTGLVMRFSTHSDFNQAQTYFATLFSSSPTQVPPNPVFLLHSLLAQVLLIYLPFGKLLHIPGIFFSRALIAKDY